MNATLASMWPSNLKVRCPQYPRWSYHQLIPLWSTTFGTWLCPTEKFARWECHEEPSAAFPDQSCMLVMLAVASPCFTLPEFLVPGDWFSHLRHPHRQPKVGNRRRHVEFPDNATWFKIIQTASKAIRSNISNMVKKVKVAAVHVRSVSGFDWLGIFWNMWSFVLKVILAQWHQHTVLYSWQTMTDHDRQTRCTVSFIYSVSLLFGFKALTFKIKYKRGGFGRNTWKQERHDFQPVSSKNHTSFFTACCSGRVVRFRKQLFTTVDRLMTAEPQYIIMGITAKERKLKLFFWKSAETGSSVLLRRDLSTPRV